MQVAIVVPYAFVALSVNVVEAVGATAILPVPETDPMPSITTDDALYMFQLNVAELPELILVGETEKA